MCLVLHKFLFIICLFLRQAMAALELTMFKTRLTLNLRDPWASFRARGKFLIPRYKAVSWGLVAFSFR